MGGKGKNQILTEELFRELSIANNLDQFIQKHENEMSNIDLPTYLYELMERAKFTIAQLIDKASISRSLAYQIFSGQRTPNRNLLIRLAITMKLTLEETQRLLRLAKKGELYPRIQRDAAIIFCIQHNYSLIDSNELLDNLGESILLKED